MVQIILRSPPLASAGRSRFVIHVPAPRAIHTSLPGVGQTPDDGGMAEGDTVHATAARLREHLSGRVLTRTDLRVPRFATADLSGRVMDDVIARGKHLLMRTDHGETVHSHLGMDGTWSLHAAGQRWHGSASEIRAVLQV